MGPRAFHFLLHCCLLFLLAVATIGYRHWAFAGDGLHNYSMFRNILAGLGAWSDPWYEYFLGNRAMLTAHLLILPFIALFRTPLVLIYSGIACWYAAALLAYHSARTVLASEKLAGLSAAIFFTTPIVMQLSLPGQQTFNADEFLAPAILLLFCGLLNRSRLWYFLSIALITLTTEESQVWLPLILITEIAWYRLLRGEIWLSKKDLLATAVLYLVLCAVSWNILWHYRALNIFNVAPHATQPFSSLLSALSHWKPGAWAALRLGASSLPLLAWLLAFGGLPASIVALSGHLLFLFGRLAVDLILYGRTQSLFWHSHVLVAPMIFLAGLSGLGIGAKVAANPRTFSILRGLLIGTLALNLLLNIGYGTDPFRYAWRLRQDWPLTRAQRAQMNAILAAIPEPETPGEVIVAAEHCAIPFLYKRSALDPNEWLALRKDPRYDRARRDPRYGDLVRYAVLRKAETSPEDLKNYYDGFSVILETEDYLALKRR